MLEKVLKIMELYVGCGLGAQGPMHGFEHNILKMKQIVQFGTVFFSFFSPGGTESCDWKV